VTYLSKGPFAQIHVDSRSRCSHLLFLFLPYFERKKNQVKENKRAVCPDFYLIYICMCTPYTIRSRDNAVYLKEPDGRSKLISDATESFKRISERIFIEVSGLCIHLCVDRDLVVVCVASCG
jgi:hypothetical protein